MFKSGFYNSKNRDRLYNAADMNQPYKRIISNGVVPVPSDSLQITAKTGMQIQVEAGFGIFGDGWAENDAPVTLTLNNSHATLNRKDLIVVRRDDNESVRNTDIFVKTGTPATNPVAPTVERSAYIKEYALAEVYIGKGVQSITQTNIIDTRADTDRCGWCTSLIQQVDTSTLFRQWQAAYEEFFNTSHDEFDRWFNNIKETLATATLIRQYSSTYKVTKNNTEIVPIDISQYNKDLDILEVYVNGWKLINTIDYTSDDTHIHFKLPLDIDTIVNIEIFKSIDGENAETVINEVVELQNKVSALDNNVYYCNGSNDNVGLKDFIDSFLLGAPTKNTIEIVGRFGVDETKSSASDNKEYSFVYKSEQGVTLDFNKCEVITANGNFMFVENVKVINCSILYIDDKQKDLIAIGSKNATFIDCYIYGSISNGFAFSGEKSTYIECIVELKADAMITGIDCKHSILNNCKVKVQSKTASSYAVEIGTESRAEGCTFKGITEATDSSSSGNGGIGGGYFSNCLFDGFGGLKGYGFYVRSGSLFNAHNCIFRGYTKNAVSGSGIGVTGAADDATTILLLGINCNQVNVNGYHQTKSLEFTKAYGVIAGTFYSAAITPGTVTSIAAYVRNLV